KIIFSERSTQVLRRKFAWSFRTVFRVLSRQRPTARLKKHDRPRQRRTEFPHLHDFHASRPCDFTVGRFPRRTDPYATTSDSLPHDQPRNRQTCQSPASVQPAAESLEQRLCPSRSLLVSSFDSNSVLRYNESTASRPATPTAQASVLVPSLITDLPPDD